MRAFIRNAFILLPALYLISCSKKTYPGGTYQQTAITVDGNLSEWDRPLRFSTNSGLVQYNVTNDKDNIYISVETHDEHMALKILRSGIDVYFDPAGGENKDIKLAFPMPNNTLTVNSPDKNTKPDKNELKQEILLRTVSFNTTGFKNMENRLYPVTDKSKIKVAIKNGDNNELGYEAAIPIKYIFGDDAPKKDMRNITVGVVINAMKSVAGNYNHPSGGGQHAGSGMHGGGGGMHGGGRGMGGGGGNYSRGSSGENTGKDPETQGYDRSTFFKEDANWYKFKLAAK